MTDELKQAYVKKAITDKLKTGRFKDTGTLYTPEQAQKDAEEPKLRMVLYYDTNGLPRWRQEERKD
jgi:hypothetical protein